MDKKYLFQDIAARLARMSPLAWGVILLIIAFLLVQVPLSIFKKFAILPGVLSLLFFYQAIFRGKV